MYAHRSQSHSSELAAAYGPGDLTDYLVHFINHLNPNGNNSTLLSWPKYNSSSGSTQLLTLLDGTTPLAVTNDTYREGAMALIVQLSLGNGTVL